MDSKADIAESRTTDLKDGLMISQVLKRIENLWYIADTCNSALTTGIDDITGFRRHGKP